ncbi:AT-hook motif nuclear-localized protein 10-like [Solanum lycopersicum]|uniref:AT-hook motif nuclear-localized protein 10-like n=1 Tax=Solanum lycopersicum TaxID=4081 RepID=UPI000532EF0E|nr:AT-hook motif nuclear-localized protein 10-like [Solanum lycopersicum]
MFPAKIIIHQPAQDLKKRGPPRKYSVHGFGLSPYKISESRGASASEKLSKETPGRPQSFGEKNQPQDLVVSSVKLRESIIGGGTVTYEGQYDIISLSGSLLLPDDNDSPGITGGLNVLLSRPDGSNICGIVAEMLKDPVEVLF